MRKTFTLVAIAVTAALVSAACSKGGPTSPTNSVTVSPSSVSVAVGETTNFTVTASAPVTCNAGGGTVTMTGNTVKYQAQSAGSFVLNCNAGSATGSANITVMPERTNSVTYVSGPPNGTTTTYTFSLPFVLHYEVAPGDVNDKNAVMVCPSVDGIHELNACKGSYAPGSSGDASFNAGLGDSSYAGKINVTYYVILRLIPPSDFDHPLAKTVVPLEIHYK